MPAKIDRLNAVIRLFLEMAKNPAEFFVNVKLHGTTVPDALSAVNTPTTVPGGALFFTLRLLILIVIQLSDRQWGRLIGTYVSLRRGEGDSSIAGWCVAKEIILFLISVFVNKTTT